MSLFIRILIVIIGIAIVISYLSPSPTPNHSGVVEWVIDGDTIIVDGMTIRLIGINTPELPSPAGESAKWYLINLVFNKRVDLICDGYDKYDRWLCDVMLGDVNIGDVLVNQGLARVWVDYGTS